MLRANYFLLFRMILEIAGVQAGKTDSPDSNHSNLQESREVPKTAGLWNAHIQSERYAMDIDEGSKNITLREAKFVRTEDVSIGQIIVTSPTGRKRALDIGALDTVEINAEIHNKERIPRGQQNLTFAGQPLQDGRNLSDYNVQKETIYHLMLRKRGEIVYCAASAWSCWNKCIPLKFRCDGKEDCSDGLDEQSCPRVETWWDENRLYVCVIAGVILLSIVLKKVGKNVQNRLDELRARRPDLFAV